MQTLPQDISDSLAFVQTALVPAYSSARGFVTGRRVYQLGTEGVYEAQAFYYDRNGRVVQKNSSGGMRGTRHETTRYSFTGNPVERLVAFNANVNGTRHALTEAFSYEYNTYTDQLVSIAHSINGSAPVTLASYTYDALGRTATKTIGGTETVSYHYNIRSWPTKIQSEKFTELMAYNASANGMTVNYPRWNGDISALCWKGDGKGATYRGYELDYDSMDRLVCAWYGAGLNFSGTDDYYDEYFTYDRMGNITNLMRGGRLDDDSYGFVDDLDMEYDGNRLMSVYDYSSDDDPTYEGVMQFTDNADEDEEYEYDANGNMTVDLNSNISSVQYNCLNLPSEVTVCRELAPSPPLNTSIYENTTMRYIYNADGEKLQATPEQSHFYLAGGSALPSGVQLRDGGMRADSVAEAGARGRDGGVMPPVLDLSTRYCGNVIFERGSLKMLLTDEGYVTFTSGGTPVYHYYLRDHLGNVRVVFTGGFLGVIEQRNDYYPSGALMASSTDGSVQPYKYNGKELERTAGLDLYDYGARWMDSKVGARFTTMDPMCEKYYQVSPYAYCHGNPTNRIDPDGKDDYYTTNGQYLYSDNKETDHIRIVNSIYSYVRMPAIIQHLSVPIESTNLSGVAYSRIYTNILYRKGFDTSLLTNGRLSIIKLQSNNNHSGPQYGERASFYNMSPEPIPWRDAPLAKTSLDGNRIRIKVYIHPLGDFDRQYLSTVSNVISVLGVHEYLGHGIQKYTEDEHWKILSIQQNHWSWKTVTNELKNLYDELQKTKKEYKPH